MKKFILLCITCLFPLMGNAFNDLDGALKNYYSENKISGSSETIDDHTWLRRVSVNVGGRIPTEKEIEAFTTYKSPDKKYKFVEKLLYSEDYVNNFYNFWADLLRIRPERLSDNIGLVRSYPYMEYVRDSIRQDVPYNNFVQELLTANGKFGENASTGYMFRDVGMPLDNLATTLQLFIGKDIACAQCHDDPFQDYSQMQFYQMAAFFNTLDNRESRKDYGELLKRIDGEIKEITKVDRIDNNVRQLISSNLFVLKNNDAKTLKLPHDYKYSDAKPNDVVVSASLDASLKNVKEEQRNKISAWIINHPDFSLTISNRIWEHLVGKPLVDPVVNFNKDDYPEGKILVFLGNYLKANNYSIKKLVWLITTSDFYSRTALKDSPTYKFQAPMVKRMKSTQLWDSILTLLIPDVNYTRISFKEYSKLITVDLNTTNGQQLLDRMVEIREWEGNLNKNILRFNGVELARSAFILNKSGFVGQFLREYGSSDRILIDSSDDKGSITQVLTLMNSPISKLLSDKKSFLYNKPPVQVFISIMGRMPTIEESSHLSKLSNDDLIWVLLNSKEFIFIK